MLKMGPHFISPTVECDEEGDTIEYQMDLNMLELGEKDVEPGDILMFQGEVYEVVGFVRKNKVITGLTLVLHLCYEA